MVITGNPKRVRPQVTNRPAWKKAIVTLLPEQIYSEGI